jgi:hypothetical protein
MPRGPTGVAGAGGPVRGPGNAGTGDRGQRRGRCRGLEPTAPYGLRVLNCTAPTRASE